MTKRGLLLFAAMCVIWGIPYLLIRVAVGGIAPAVLVFGRTTIGALILMPFVLARGGLRGLGRKWVPLLAYAVCEVGIPWFFLSSAEQQLSSSLAALLISCVPLIATLIAPLFGRKAGLGGLGITGLVVGLAGVVAIVGIDFQSSNTTALLEMILVTVGYALGPAIVNRYLDGVPSMTVNGVSLAACALVYAPIAAFQWPSALPAADVLGSVAVLGVVCTALAFLLFFSLIREIGPVRATVITYINPAVAAIAGVLVLKENFTLGMAIGFVLVLGGSFLATRGSRAAAAERKTEVSAGSG